jgi:RNA polymerase sigma-70 factor (ECF subfamily)
VAEPTDSEIVAAVRKGQRQAFNTLVARYHPRMVAAAYQMIGDYEMARDLAQESFVEAYRCLRKLRDGARAAPWLFGILRRRCGRYATRRRPAEAALDERDLDPQPAPDDMLERRERERAVQAALMGLAPQYREALVARYHFDLGYAEIARMLRTTPDNVRVLCFRAKQALRAAIERREGSRS